MSITRFSSRIHPLVAVAAATVTLFSLLGIAAVTGLLPASHGTSSNEPSAMAQPSSAVSEEWDPNKPVPKAAQPRHASPAPSPSRVATETTQRSTANPAPVQAQRPPVPQNSPVGIGVGAVIGGVLGNQVGSGDGKTLATILGAVGGGYVGNEVAKQRNQQP
jgi:uncharacterized protein YcfJ